MTLKIYFDHLKRYIKTHPEALNMEVRYAIDEEGNGFEPVLYTPSIYDLGEESFVIIN